MTFSDRNAAERELTTLISRALRSIPYVKLDRVDEVAESFREALDLLEANCDLTAQDIEELEKIRRSAESSEPPQHVPAGWPPVDSDDDESDDERKKDHRKDNNTGSTLSGVNHSNVESKEAKRLVPKVNATAVPDPNEEKQRLLGLTGPNRPITKEVGISASPRTSSRGLGGGGGAAASGAAAKRAASSRANAGTKTYGLNPNLPEDLTISSAPAVVSAAITHSGSSTSSTTSPNAPPQIPRGPRSGHDGSPLLTPRSIGRKMAGKGEKQTSPRRKLGLGNANGIPAPAKTRSRFENVVTRLPSSDEEEEDEGDEDEDENVDMEDESVLESKLESKMSPRTAFNHNLKKRQRQNDPPLPVTASPAHFASSRVLLQLASQPSSPQPDYNDLLPPEARAIIGPLTPAHPSAAASAAGTLTSISSLPNAAAPIVPGSPGSTGTPKPAFLRRLDSPQSHHGKLLAAKNKVRNMLMQAVHILPKMRPEAFEKVRDKFLDAVNKLERATVEQ